MADRSAAMLQMIQQLQRQSAQRQNGTSNASNTSGGRPSLNSIIEMVSRSNNYGNQKIQPNNSSINGNASSMEFASSTGSGGTWQRDNSNNTYSNGITNGYSMISSMNNMPPPVCFKCSECNISKNNCEDLEIHIKTEHLNWLPFRCQFCSAQRASDTQIREHVYSSHKRDDTKYLYIDNPQAKRKLTQMLDKALILATAALAAKRSAGSIQTANGVNGQPLNKKPRLDNQIIDNEQQEMQPRASATVTVLPRSNTSDILAQLTAGTKNDSEEGRIEDNFNITENGRDDQASELGEQLSQLFGNTANNITSELEEECNNDTSYLSTDNEASKSLLENIHALFGSVNSNTPSTIDTYKQKPKMTRAPRNINCVSKKRVLGECSRCQKPVTAGARQMHMFYHLAKDQNTYRFKCKFDNCDVQHYRKDQMENHQSKMHGRIDPDMMEDRSSQLHDIVQVLSMELLGTSGNQPGPTAERAQATYNNMQRDAVEANKKRRRTGFVRSEQGVDFVPSSPSTSNSTFPDGLPTMVKPEPRLEEQIECSLCKKYIVARTRGFHILWHLNNDLNIVRYHCKHCEFKHDRSQSISNHGLREHNDEKCVIDTIDKYDEEIRSMSKACFGIEQPFTKESSRTKRIRKEAEESEGKLKLEDILFSDQFELDLEPKTELDENEQISETHSETSDEHKSAGATVSPILITKAEVPDMQQPQTTGETQQVSAVSWTKRNKSTRRFGTRKPKSKKQKLEMAKQRELSMVLGGAQYFKRRPNEVAFCHKCDKQIMSKLSQHAYSHIDQPLFECPMCHLGNSIREIVSKHMKDLHGSTDNPIDNRLKYAKEVKQSVKDSYPNFFIDAPIPTIASIERIKQQLGIEGDILNGGEVEEEHESDNDESTANVEDDTIETIPEEDTTVEEVNNTHENNGTEQMVTE